MFWKSSKPPTDSKFHPLTDSGYLAIAIIENYFHFFNYACFRKICQTHFDSLRAKVLPTYLCSLENCFGIRSQQQKESRHLTSCLHKSAIEEIRTNVSMVKKGWALANRNSKKNLLFHCILYAMLNFKPLFCLLWILQGTLLQPKNNQFEGALWCKFKLVVEGLWEQVAVNIHLTRSSIGLMYQVKAVHSFKA